MAKASAMVVSRLYRLSSVSLFLHGCSAADAVVKPSSRCLHILSSARTRVCVCVCMCTCTRARLCSAVKIILFMTISNHVIHSSETNRSKACNQTLRFSCGRVWPRQTSRGGHSRQRKLRQSNVAPTVDHRVISAPDPSLSRAVGRGTGSNRRRPDVAPTGLRRLQLLHDVCRSSTFLPPAARRRSDGSEEAATIARCMQEFHFLLDAVTTVRVRVAL